MIIRAKLSALKEGRWYEYVIRFLLGGATTLIAGIIADIWGPENGGLFLAFPPFSVPARPSLNLTNGAKSRSTPRRPSQRN
jgi:hypothetical protein